MILGNSGRWFEEAMGLEVTRKWVERAIDQGDEIYIIVGFHTLSNARIIQESVLGRQTGVQVSLPVGLSITAVGVIMPLAKLIPVSPAIVTDSVNVGPLFVICVYGYLLFSVNLQQRRMLLQDLVNNLVSPLLAYD